MRYTTAIDISEFPELYGNKQIVLLYFHLCLKCGYHADDRDIYRRSVRALAREVGITYSACRHALNVLQKHGMVFHQADHSIKVHKWIEPANVPKRLTKVQQKDADAYREKVDEMQRRDEKFAQMDKERKEGRTGIVALLTHLEAEAARGDERAKKEAQALRLELEKKGVLKPLSKTS